MDQNVQSVKVQVLRHIYLTMFVMMNVLYKHMNQVEIVYVSIFLTF